MNQRIGLLIAASFLLAVLATRPADLRAQPTPAAWTGVVQAPGMSANQLYANGFAFVNKQWTDWFSEVQHVDPDQGKLIASGSVRYNGVSGLGRTATEGLFTYTLTIEVKEGRYRYLIENVNHVSYFVNPDFPGVSYSGGNVLNEKPDTSPLVMGKKTWQKIQEDAMAAMEKLKSNLQNTMMPNGGNDW